jgi:hypothetical protein
MNPYVQDVLVPATNELQRQTENARAGLGARAAAAGAYGGSRGALQEAQLDRSLQETGSRLVADTMAQAYDKATALAEGNTNRQQQTSLQNANNAMQGANTMISSAGMLDSLLNSDFSRGRSVISDLLSTGAFQQNDMQDQLNAPYEALARLFQYVPQIYESTTTGTQPDNSPSPWAQILGIGGQAAHRRPRRPGALIRRDGYGSGRRAWRIGGFFQRPAVQDTLDAIFTSMISSPRNNVLQNFAPAYNAAQDRRALMGEQAAMQEALVAAGLSPEQAKVMAVNPQAAKLRLDMMERQRDMEEAGAAAWADL